MFSDSCSVVWLQLSVVVAATSLGRHFIPVVITDNDNTEIRAVFDASTRRPAGKSLDIFLRSQEHVTKHINSVPSISARVFCGHLYLRLLVLPEFRSYQNILRRFSPHAEFVEYELNTFTYDVDYASFLVHRL